MRLTRVAEDGEVIHLACEGEITQNDPRPGRDPMDGLLGPAGFSGKVLLSLERATYIDSRGISWLLVCHKHFVENKGLLVVHTIPPRVNHVLQIVRMPLVLNLAADLTAARALVSACEVVT